MSQGEYYDFVNIVKLILAILIVAMHSGAVPDFPFLLTHICRLGVPYFFVASGFFLQRKCIVSGPEEAVKGYVKRLSLPFIVFSIIWIVQMLIDDAIACTGVWNAVINVLQHILFFPRGALWYVRASIIGALMLYPFMKKKKYFQALALSIAFFIVGLFTNNYYFAVVGTQLQPVVDTYLRICLTSNNALFVGCVFLTEGIILYEYYDTFTEKVGTKSLITIILISFVALACEASFIRNIGMVAGDGAFYLSQLIYVPTVFYLTTLIRCRYFSKDFIMMAKNFSTSIYFLHVPVLWVIHRSATYLFPHIPGLTRIGPLFDHAIVCFLCCLVLCCLICFEVYKYPNSFICKILK